MDEREEGIRAIIYLQSLAGIKEPRDRAERAWDNFSEWDRQNTMAAYHRLRGLLN